MYIYMNSSIASGLRTDLRCQFKESSITVKKGAFENFADNLVFWVFRDRHFYTFDHFKTKVTMPVLKRKCSNGFKVVVNSDQYLKFI